MNDSELSALLQNWKAPPPSGNFDAHVWRRIRLATPAPRPTAWTWLTATTLRLGAVAATLALLAGAWAGQATRPAAPVSFSLARAGTVTGAYAGLIQEEAP